MRLITVNEGRNMGTAGYTSDLHKIKNEFPKAIIGWQEIDEADPANEHAVMREVFKGYQIINFEYKEPITLPAKVKVVDHKVIHLSKGVAHTSPPRIANEVWIETKYSDKPIVIINTHLIAGAWNNKIEPNQELRRELWNQSVEKLRKRIEFHHNAGRTVFWMGDMNRMDMPKLHKDERRIVSSGIDSISVIVGSVGVRVIDTGSLPLASDHDAKWAKVELFERKA